VVYAGSVKDGERFLGLHDGQVDFDPDAMSADEAARADLCRHIDATVFGEGTLPKRISWPYGKLNFKVSAADMAQFVCDAVDGHRFYIFSHPNALVSVQVRLEAVTTPRHPIRLSTGPSWVESCTPICAAADLHPVTNAPPATPHMRDALRGRWH